jgi:IMP dehydrogenase
MITCIGQIRVNQIITINPFDSVRRAALLMEESRIGGLPVMDNDQLVGIITSRDIRVAHSNRLVADVMTRQVVTAPPRLSLLEAKQLLEEHNIERLVVIDGERPVGVITKSHLYSELSKHIDALTGLAKAGYVQGKAQEWLHDGQEICIIFLDLDDFGRINKELGHVVGDEILKQVALVLKGIVDEDTDYLCRYAGDEFAVVTRKGLGEAKQLASQMIDALHGEKWPGNTTIKASAGISSSHRMYTRDYLNHTYVVSDLINMASLASTKAKREKKPISLADEMQFT